MGQEEGDEKEHFIYVVSFKLQNNTPKMSCFYRMSKLRLREVKCFICGLTAGKWKAES